jgi:hypothetical protein
MLLYNAKPKNYCIDWFFYNIIEPILEREDFGRTYVHKDCTFKHGS